jgi:hypothetical protein
MIGIYIAGIITGFFLSPSYQSQIKLIGQTATVIQYPAIIGAGLAMWKTITDWYKENVLEFDGIYVKNEHYIIEKKHVYPPTYYLRIVKKRGRGRAENCEGFLTVEGIEINRNTVWEGNEKYIHISIQGDLKLFEIVQNLTDQRMLVFRSNPTNSPEGMLEYAINYSEELLDKQITIRIGASSGIPPSKPYITTIRQIIEQARKE